MVMQIEHYQSEVQRLTHQKAIIELRMKQTSKYVFRYQKLKHEMFINGILLRNVIANINRLMCEEHA